ncbi:hypothetical protein HDV01_006097 [Terramyces sp. JEL0728]|nr:hypothetical protein HDV01_006097 [Terramyces sp. JEL0728]
MQVSEETRERIQKVLELGKKALHVGWIPFILYMDIENLNKAVNQTDALVPKSRADEWFHFSFRKCCKSKLELASHPSITLVTKELVQDYVFNLIRFDYRPPHNEYEYAHQYYLGKYEWEQDLYPEKLDNEQMEAVVSEYIVNGLVDPSRQFSYETYSCLYCKTAAKKRPNLDCLNCEIFNGPFRVPEDPIAISSRYSWTLVDLMLENKKVDPSIHNQKILARALYSKEHTIVKKLLLDTRVDPGFQGKGEVKLKVFNSTVAILPLQMAITNGWLDIYLMLLQDPRTLVLSSRDKINTLAKLTKVEFTDGIRETLEHVLQTQEFVTNYVVKQAFANMNWELAKLFIKYAYKGIPIDVDLEGVPADVIRALQGFVSK